MAIKTRQPLRELTPDELEQLQEWYIRQDEYKDWRAWHEDGRRTALKGNLRAAQEAVLNQEFVCPGWPNCEHASAEHCARAWRIDQQQTRRAGQRKYGIAA